MLYLSSYASNQPTIASAVQELAGLGFTGIELTGGSHQNGFDQRQIQRLADEFGLSLLVHNYFPPPSVPFVLNPGTGEPEQLEMLKALVANAVQLSQTLGQNVYSMHAGFVSELVPVKDADAIFQRREPSRNARENMFSNIAGLVDTLPSGFHLAVENAFPAYDGKPLSLMASPEEIFDFLAFAADHPALGLLLDFGHLAVSAGILGFDHWAFLERLAADHCETILEIHLSKAVGARDTHYLNDPGDREIAFLREIRAEVAHAPIVLEWHKPDLNVAVHRAAAIAEALDRA